MVYVNPITVPVLLKTLNAIFTVLLVSVSSSYFTYETTGTVSPTPSLNVLNNYTFTYNYPCGGSQSVTVQGKFRNTSITTIEYGFFVERTSYAKMKDFYNNVNTANALIYCSYPTYSYAYLDTNLVLASSDPINPSQVDPVPDYANNCPSYYANKIRVNELNNAMVGSYYAYRAEAIVYDRNFKCYFEGKC
jgi:hypothetical protein